MRRALVLAVMLAVVASTMTPAPVEAQSLRDRISDLFIRTFNPSGLPTRSRVYSVDGPHHRRVGT